jgi:thiol:disulfide interchange protein DsbD
MWVRKSIAALSVVILSSLGLAPGAASQILPLGGRAAARVTWKVSVEPQKVSPGGTVELVASYEVVKGWYLYAPDFTGTGLATELDVDSQLLEAAGKPRFPEPEIKEEKILGETHRLLPGGGDIRRSYTVSEEAEPGKLAFNALLTYMTCSGSRCDPPRRGEPYPLSLEIAAGAASTEEKGEDDARDTPAGAGEKVEDKVQERPAETGEKAEDAPAAEEKEKAGDAARDAVKLAAGDKDERNPVSWKITVEPATVRRGERAEIVVQYDVAKGHYIYAPDQKGDGVPTAITIRSPHIEASGKPAFPEPKIKTVAGDSYRTLAGTGAIRQGFVVKPEAPPGNLRPEVRVDFMTCFEGGCYPPAEHEEAVAITVSAEPPVAAGSSQSGAAESAAGESGGEDLLEVSIWALIALMITGGLFALLMPCTYPMIPITIAYFSNQAEARKGAVLPLALAYGAGIVLSFNIIGWVFAPVIRPFAANPWVNLVFAALFGLFALSFLGFFNIQLPAAINNLSAKAQGATGYVGVFALGATLVVASFACTAPIMGPLLVIAAKGESLGRVTVGMTAFGATMAAPFVLLALFPARIQSIPRSGEWMNTLKVFLGFILLAACLVFFAKADQGWELEWFSREPFLVLCTVIFAAAGLYLLGLIRLKDEEAKGIGSLRMLAGLAALAIALYFHLGSTGYRLHWIVESFLPASRAVASEGIPVEESRIIVQDLDEGLKVARERGMKALVNFSGVQCTNCKAMERGVFPKLTQLMKNFVEIRLKTDVGDDQEEKRAYQLKLTQSETQPIYVIVDPSKPDEYIDRFDGADLLAGGKNFAEFLRRNLK